MNRTRTFFGADRCFIIAEAGVNHNGDPDLAMKLVDVALEAGADAVKFQTFNADLLATPTAPKADYQRESSDSTESQLQMLKRLQLPLETYKSLMDHCAGNSMCFMSTPFDKESADFLDNLPIELFKIPSGEITNLPLLAHIAKKSKPMILSTGMSDLDEVGTALETIKENGQPDLALMHTLSSYPAPADEVNLKAMRTLVTEFGLPVGYSDHTLGIEISLAAVAMGASILEKHFTLDRSLPGPDHKASLEPDELKSLVRGVRIVESSFGDGRKRQMPSEVNTAKVARRSLVAAKAISAGTVLTENLIAIRRPGTGLAPERQSQVLGRTLRSSIAAGELLTMEMLD